MCRNIYVDKQFGLTFAEIRSNTLLFNLLVSLIHAVALGVSDLDHILDVEESKVSFNCLKVVLHLWKFGHSYFIEILARTISPTACVASKGAILTLSND